MDKKEFGAWIKKIRIEKDMTQEDLAHKLGMAKSQELAAIESGTVAFPTERIHLLSKALGVNKEKIFKATMKIKEQGLREKMEAGALKHKPIKK